MKISEQVMYTCNIGMTWSEIFIGYEILRFMRFWDFEIFIGYENYEIVKVVTFLSLKILTFLHIYVTQ